MKSTAIAILIAAVFLGPGSAQAADDQHSHGHEYGSKTPAQQGGHGMSHGEKEGMFLEKRHIDGYDVSFHVMAAGEGMRHGGSHNLMIRIEQGGKVVSDVAINSKVIFPDGTEQGRMLMKMGDWYMAGYDLKPDGQHQLLILFKTADGQKHKGGVYYPYK